MVTAFRFQNQHFTPFHLHLHSVVIMFNQHRWCLTLLQCFLRLVVFIIEKRFFNQWCVNVYKHRQPNTQDVSSSTLKLLGCVHDQMIKWSKTQELNWKKTKQEMIIIIQFSNSILYFVFSPTRSIKKNSSRARWKQQTTQFLSIDSLHQFNFKLSGKENWIPIHFFNCTHTHTHRCNNLWRKEKNFHLSTHQWFSIIFKTLVMTNGLSQIVFQKL